MQHKCHLLVIGGGPGGYAAAIKAGQLGIDTILVEKARVGGTCLNVGCIPSKALIHVADDFLLASSLAAGRKYGISAATPTIDLAGAQDWKDGVVGSLTKGVSGLLRKAKVRVIEGEANFVDGRTVEVKTESGTERISAEVKVIATGSVSTALPGLPFGDMIMSSTELLALREVPKSLIVVGAGYIGLELGTAFRKLGTDVTVVEAGTEILPIYDKELTKPVRKRLSELGITVHCGSKVIGLAQNGKAIDVRASDGTLLQLSAEKVLVTIGRRPNTTGLEALQLDMSGPFIRIDEQCRTSMKGIYAIGDVTGEPMLAHRAMAQATMVAELVAGKNRRWDDRAIPAVCFTDPEIVTVGLSPDAAKTAGAKVVVGNFPFVGNGRSLTTGRTDGFVRVVAREDDHRVIGVQAVGQGVSELSSAFTIAIEMNARLEDVAGIIHAHPTRSEAFQESAMAAMGEALHM